MKNLTIVFEKIRDFNTLQQLQHSCFDKLDILIGIIQDKTCFILTINLIVWLNFDLIKKGYTFFFLLNI